jgi:hypothetical protein
MGRVKKHSPEQIVNILRQIEVRGSRLRKLLAPMSARPDAGVRNQNEIPGFSQERGDEPYTGRGTPGLAQFDAVSTGRGFTPTA